VETEQDREYPVDLFSDIPAGAPEDATDTSVFSFIPPERPTTMGTMEEPEKSRNPVVSFFQGLAEPSLEERRAEAASIIAASEITGKSPTEIARNKDVLPHFYEDPTFGEALKMRKDHITKTFQGAEQTHKASVAFSRAFRSGDEIAAQEAIQAFKEAQGLKQQARTMEDDPRVSSTERWIERSTSDVAGQYYAQMKGTLKYGAAGAVIGGYGGSTAGAVGAIPGAVGGFGTGIFYGRGAEIFDASLGAQTIEKIQAGIDPYTAYITSLPTAIFTTISEQLVFTQVIKHIPGVKKILSKSFAEAEEKVIKWTKQKILLEAGKTGLHGSIQEAAQTIVEQLDMEVTKQISNNLHGTNLSPKSAQQIAETVKDTFIEVLPGITALGFLGPGTSGLAQTVNRSIDERRVKQQEAPVQEEPATETVILDNQGQEVDLQETVPVEDGSIVEDAGEVQPTVEITPVEMAQQEIAGEAAPVTNEQFESLVLSDDADLDIMLDDTIAEVSATGDRYGDFVGTLRQILPRKQAKAVEALIDARARATGRTREQFAEDNKLAFRVEEDETGTLRGSVEFIQDGETIVRAFQNTTVKDVAHEIAHIFRKDMSLEENAAVESAFGVKDGNWTVESEERFAEGFVEYLATGKAPTKGLQKIFEKFKTWIGNTIAALRGKGVRISSEMAQAYDQLFQQDRDVEYTGRMRQAQEETQTLFSKRGIEERPTKTVIRERTGQTPLRSGKTVDTHTAFKEALRQQVMAARKAMIEGDKAGFAKAQAKFKAISERARQRSVSTKSRAKARKRVEKLVKSAKVKRRAGKPVGQFTAEFQEIADELIDIMSLPVRQAKEQAKQNTVMDHPADYVSDMEILRHFLLETRANMKSMDEARLNQLYDDLKAFFEQGRLDRATEIGGRIARVAEANKEISDSLAAIRQRLYDNPEARDAYENETGMVKKMFDKYLRNFVIFDFHGFMEMLDMGLEKMLGEGFAQKFGETLDQENASNTGRRTMNQKVLGEYARIFNIQRGEVGPVQEHIYNVLGRDVEAESRTDQAILRAVENRLLHEEREGNIDLGQYEILKKETVDGETVYVGTGKYRVIRRSRSELRKMWMELQDPELREVYEKDGMPPEMAAAIESALTQQDIEFARAQLKIYDEYYDRINKVYRRVYGTNLPRRENYSPILRDIDTGTEDGPISDLLTDMSVPQTRFAGAGSPYLKTRVNSSALLRAQSDVAAMSHYIRQMEHFIAFAEKVQELNGVFKNNQLREQIRDTYGENFLEMIDGALLNIARNGKQRGDNGAWEKGLQTIRGNLARGLVGLKPLATVKQLSSFYAYSEKMGTKDFINGVLEFLRNPLENARELRGVSQFIQNRGDTMERDIAMLTNSSEFNDIIGRRLPPSFNRVVMMFVKAGDIGAIYAGGWAYYKHLLSQGYTQEQAVQEFERMSRNTQQSSELGSMSAAQQGNAVMKLLTMFTTSQRQYAQKALLALEAKAAERITGDQFLKQAFIYLGVLPVMFQLISQGGAEDKEDMKKLLKAVVTSPLSAIPIGNMAFEYIFSGLLLGHTYGRGMANMPILSPAESAYKGAKRVFAKDRKLSMDDISYRDVLRGIRDMLAITEYAGIPGRQIGNVLLGIDDTVRGEALQGVMEVAGMSPYSANRRADKIKNEE